MGFATQKEHRLASRNKEYVILTHKFLAENPVALIWLFLAQSPPIDPGFFGEWERLGVVGILVAVIAFGGWLFMRLLNQEIARSTAWNAENSQLVRQNEHLSLEAIGAVREMSQELKNLSDKLDDLERMIALLESETRRR